jgi:succinate dehydrogenase / fumarate reductase flavoprotein subunit
VKFYPEHYALSLVFDRGRCHGVVTYDLTTGDLHFLQANAVLMATGGCGRIYKTTSNGFAGTGDGLVWPSGEFPWKTWNSSVSSPAFTLSVY